MTSIEITRPHPENPSATQVVIDGADLSMALSDLRLDFDGPDAPTATVTIGGVEHLRLCSTDAQLVIDPASVELLVKHGWTPPPIESGPRPMSYDQYLDERAARGE